MAVDPATERYAYYAGKVGIPGNVAREFYSLTTRSIQIRREIFKAGGKDDNPQVRHAARRPYDAEMRRIVERQKTLRSRYPSFDRVQVPRVRRGGLGGAFRNWFSDAWPVIATAVTAGYAGVAAAATTTTAATTATGTKFALDALKFGKQFIGGGSPVMNQPPNGSGYIPENNAMPPDSSPNITVEMQSQPEPKKLPVDVSPVLLLVFVILAVLLIFTRR